MRSLPDDHAFGSSDAPDNGRPLAVAFEYRDGLRRIAFGQGDDHTDTHVEDIEHFAVVDFPVLFEEAEHGKDFPGFLLYLDTLSFLQDAGDVLVEPAAGNVADAVYVALCNHVEHLFHVYFRRSQQHLAQRPFAEFGIDLFQTESVVRHNFAHEAEAVGMHAARCDAHEHVSNRHPGAV